MRETRLLQVSLGQPSVVPEGDPLQYNLENVLATLDGAAAFDPDVVVFPELIVNAKVREEVPPADLAQPIPGPVTEAVAPRARDLESYVWLPMYERDRDRVFNAVALLGPDGDVCGTYRKVAPTANEMERRGVTPGKNLPVWETEVGRMAASICWDVRYDEIGLAYGMQDVDLHVHPTLGLGQGKLRSWAVYHGYHVAYCYPGDLFVWTPYGARVGRSRSPRSPSAPTVTLHGDGDVRYASTVINTDMVTLSRAVIGDRLDDVQRAYPNAVHTHSMFEDATIVCESRSHDVTMDEIVAEFDLETTRAYEDRVRDRIHEAVDGSPLLESNFAG